MLRSAAVCRNDANLNSRAQRCLTLPTSSAPDQAVSRQRWLRSSSQHHHSRQATITKAGASCTKSSWAATCRPPATVEASVSSIWGYGSQSRTQPTPARAVSDADNSSGPDEPEQALSAADEPPPPPAAAASNQGVQKQPSAHSQQQQGPKIPPAQTVEGRSSPPQQQQQTRQDQQQQQQQAQNLQQQLTAGQFRQQLLDLMRQQQQLQQVLDATAAAGLQGTSRGSSSRGKWGRKHSSSSLRAAAGTSTDLLLSLLQSQLPVLTGQVPLQPGMYPTPAPPPATGTASVGAVQASRADQPVVLQQQEHQQQQQTEQHQRNVGSTRPPYASTQQQQRTKPRQQQRRTKLQQQRTKPQQQPQPQGRKYRCAPGSPPHLPLLAEAITTIAWHCRHQQLLPSEAGRLQGLLLAQLLPALRPNLAQVNKRQLARLVFSLGSCYAAAAAGQEEDQGEEGQQQLPGMQAEAKPQGSRSKQQQQEAEGGTGLRDGDVRNTSEPPPPAAAAGAAAAGDPQTSDGSSSSSSGRGTRLSPSLRAARAAAAAAAASAGWVLRLLRLLPPSSLTAGALLSVWQGCALHELRPPGDWLQQASWVMVGHLRQRKLDFNDMAGLLQACAALDYRPPGWLMVPLVSDLQQRLGMLTPADLAGVLDSLQALRYRPPDTWLRVWCEVSSRHLAGMTLPQLASAAGALAWTSYSPAAWWGRRLTAAALPLLPVATADELLLLLHSLLTLRLGVAAGWVHQAYCHLARQREGLGLSQLADAAHVLGGMGGLTPDVVRVHRAWLAVCLQRVGGWQGGAAAAALSRSELLYMLYAAARLRVSPGDTLTAAALHRLHQELTLASPAELAGCLSVFCFWWRQQQQQQQQQQQSVSTKQQQQQQEEEEGGTSGDAAAASNSSSSRRVVSLVQLRDCLSAVVSCSRQFSGEGLLQLLMTCAKASTPAAAAPPPAAAAGGGGAEGPPSHHQHQQQQQQWEVDARLLHEVEFSIESLVCELLGRLPGMSLVQLARLSRSLEAGPSSSSSSSGSSSAGSGSSSGSSAGSGSSIGRRAGSGSGKSSSGGVGAGVGVGEEGRRRPEWYVRLTREVKAAMGARA